jgi:indole-3-glycerol phosphate synthase
MTLEAILEVTRTRVAALKRRAAGLEKAASGAPPPRPFLPRWDRRGPSIGVVAEIKRRSPSQGAIRPDLDPVAYATGYARGGASGISVLTEERHFGGSLEDLAAVAAAVQIPVLRKDFIIDELQLLEALVAGASAVLLIARVLPPARLAALARTAGELGLGTLIEIHTESELEPALAAAGTAVGVNARDLNTLAMDPAGAERLLAKIPAEVVTVAESGIASRADVERVASAGADYVLVGTSVARRDDPESAVRALCGVKRKARD